MITSGKVVVMHLRLSVQHLTTQGNLLGHREFFLFIPWDCLQERAVQGRGLGSGKVGGEGERLQVLKLLPVCDPKNRYECRTFQGGKPHQTARRDCIRVCFPAKGRTN